MFKGFYSINSLNCDKELRLPKVQMSNDESKEWLNRKIRDKSITCYSESDLKLDPTHIGHGGFGVVHKATIKKSGIIVARKTSSPGQYGDDGEYFKHFVKEVCYLLLLRYSLLFLFIKK